MPWRWLEVQAFGGVFAVRDQVVCRCAAVVIGSMPVLEDGIDSIFVPEAAE